MCLMWGLYSETLNILYCYHMMGWVGYNGSRQTTLKLLCSSLCIEESWICCTLCASCMIIDWINDLMSRPIFFKYCKCHYLFADKNSMNIFKLSLLQPSLNNIRNHHRSKLFQLCLIWHLQCSGILWLHSYWFQKLKIGCGNCRSCFEWWYKSSLCH